MLNKLQVQQTGRKRANSFGADFAVERTQRTAIVEKNDRRALRQLWAPQLSSWRPPSGTWLGAQTHLMGGIELSVIDRPIAPLEINAMGASRLPWNGGDTDEGRR